MRYLILLFFLNTQAFCQKIDTTQVITIGDIKQVVQIKGDDLRKPLLVFLHGGPGSSVMNKSEKITGRLEKEFVVVHWDQRETGKTLGLNKTNRPLTLEMFYDDTNALVDTLLRRFARSKLYLVGYSWGSGLGFQFADKHPEKLYAYIAVSPVIDSRTSDSLSLHMLKTTMGNKARRELSQVKTPFENWEQLYIHRKWLMKQEGQKLLALSLPKSFVQNWSAIWFDVWSRSNTVNLFKSLPSLKCPLYIFSGAKDYNTSAVVAEKYITALSAPKKYFYLFEDAGHALPETHSTEFQKIILSEILPQTFHQ